MLTRDEFKSLYDQGPDAVFALISSYISTLRKQGQSLLPALEHVFMGSPIYPQLQG